MEPHIPAQYSTYFFSGALTEGSTEAEPGYFILWHPDEIDRNNADLRIEEYAPGFIAFGGNGGGELLVFDKEGTVCMLPMIGMEPRSADKIAASWQDFERHIRETGKAE